MPRRSEVKLLEHAPLGIAYSIHQVRSADTFSRWVNVTSSPISSLSEEDSHSPTLIPNGIGQGDIKSTLENNENDNRRTTGGRKRTKRKRERRSAKLYDRSIVLLAGLRTLAQSRQIQPVAHVRSRTPCRPSKLYSSNPIPRSKGGNVIR